ncbi:uncharacterized protein LOC130746422 [Lotus japonicus]|uniref:uncharacterized protein LOC130746422 n=1 Tax=Lotus japonicus TaxID=34305 RepID=UPI00258F82D3|nr:uncharacterized protein LOC130746422 [Lotus japonicus]
MTAQTSAKAFFSCSILSLGWIERVWWSWLLTFLSTTFQVYGCTSMLKIELKKLKKLKGVQTSNSLWGRRTCALRKKAFSTSYGAKTNEVRFNLIFFKKCNINGFVQQ